MNIQQLYEFCLSKKGVTEHFPFDEDTLVFKVGGKMFCLTSLKQWESNEPSLNLKCDPQVAIELREKFDGITPGYHMSKIHWNTVILDGSVPKDEIEVMIENSYDLVVDKLPKKDKRSLNFKS